MVRFGLCAIGLYDLVPQLDMASILKQCGGKKCKVDIRFCFPHNTNMSSARMNTKDNACERQPHGHTDLIERNISFCCSRQQFSCSLGIEKKKGYLVDKNVL